METKPLIPVLMTEEVATQFVLFQKRYDIFKHLEEEKAFDIGFGKIVLNFAGGVLHNITKEEVVYRRP